MTADTEKKFHLIYAVFSAVIIGLIAQILSYAFDFNYAYRDSIFRMEAARRFFDSLEPGIINQIGTVWLPIPNLFLMPFASIDYFYHTGIAASIVNYPAFILCAVMIFLSLKELTKDVYATWTGFIIFILNYNILYFQTTAMTEQLYLLFTVGNFYFLLLWAKDFRIKNLIYSSLFLALGTASRYDAWAVLAGSFVITGIISIFNKKPVIKNLAVYSALPVLIILWWFVHNYIYYGDALEFSRGKFSTLHQLTYYEEAGRLLTKNNFFLSVKVYLYSVLYYSGNFYFFLSVAGLIYYFIKNKFDTKSYVPYVLLIALPTSLILLYKGQVIIEHPSSEPEGYFNSRYGLYMFPAVAVFSGYLVLLLKKIKWRKQILLILFAGILIQQLTFFYNFPYSIPSLAEAKYSYSQASIDLSEYLKDNYEGGKILYDNTVFALHPWTGINLRDRITFHTPYLGELAMKYPSYFVQWIIIYTDAPNDKIYAAMKGNKNFENNFKIMFSEKGIEVYRKVANF
jgi:hypothetical protein